ncbi:MAG: mechanosensitive ion channel family protein [Myxococcales bacterium]|nr:mechanosensitive ion channel family protein [Myxococcales bacterium]
MSSSILPPPFLLPGMEPANIPQSVIRRERRAKEGLPTPKRSSGKRSKPLMPEGHGDGTERVVWGAAWAFLALVVMWSSQLAQERLASQGLLPSLFKQVTRLSGVMAVLFALWGSAALLPQIPPEVLWGAMAAGVLLLLVAARGLLPDVLAGMLIVSERRIATGMLVEGEGFSGTVVGTGWRCTILRTPRGLLELPNRKLLAGPLRTAGSSEHELILRLRPGLPADTTRRQIEDVVIASAWTPPNPQLRVYRDPRNPHRWVIHTRLLDPRFASIFDAELPERLERRLDSLKEGDEEVSLGVPAELVDVQRTA